MLGKMTPQECVASILGSVDHWTRKGLDPRSAMIVVSELRDIEYKKVEYFFVQREADKLDNITELD